MSLKRNLWFSIFFSSWEQCGLHNYNDLLKICHLFVIVIWFLRALPSAMHSESRVSVFNFLLLWFFLPCSQETGDQGNKKQCPPSSRAPNRHDLLYFLFLFVCQVLDTLVTITSKSFHASASVGTSFILTDGFVVTWFIFTFVYVYNCQREYKQKQKSKTKENIWTDIQVDGAGFKVMCVTHPKNIQPLSSWGEEGQGGSQPSTFRTTFTRLPVHLCLLASRLPLIY